MPRFAGLSTPYLGIKSIFKEILPKKGVYVRGKIGDYSQGIFRTSSFGFGTIRALVPLKEDMSQVYSSCLLRASTGHLPDNSPAHLPEGAEEQ